MTSTFFSNRSLLLTGASGYIGRRLCERLVESGAHVTLLQRSGGASPAGALPVIVPDWTPAGLEKALATRHFDGVFNLAAYGVHPGHRDAEEMRRVNTTCAIALHELSALSGSRFFLQAGTSAEYAPAARHVPVAEDSPPETTRLYGGSKARATAGLLAASARLDARLIVARIFGVYGPDEPPHRLLATLLSGLVAGRRVPMSHGQQIRDFMHVDDVVSAMCALPASVAATPGSLVVNVCTGIPTTVAAFSQQVARAMNAPSSLLGLGDIPVRPDDLEYVVGSTALLSSVTAWRPELTLAEGIRAAIASSSNLSAPG
jgi:nucleoside-diphosphate-sugar epimerase